MERLCAGRRRLVPVSATLGLPSLVGGPSFLMRFCFLLPWSLFLVASFSVSVVVGFLFLVANMQWLAMAVVISELLHDLMQSWLS